MGIVLAVRKAGTDRGEGSAGAKNVQGRNEMWWEEGQGRWGEGGRRRSEMQFFRSALFPATGEPPVLVSATFKFVPLSALFAEKCLFNFVYRHCKIFTRSLLLEQFSHHRERWILDDVRRLRGPRGSGDDRVNKFTICIKPHFPMLLWELTSWGYQK